MTKPSLDQVVCCSADVLEHVPAESVDAWITSIPFESMRHYSDDPRDLGNLQAEGFVAMLVPVIAEWRRTLKPTGNLLLNFQPQTIGRVLSPSTWLLPQALAANGFHLVQELTVIKTNSMPLNDPRLLRRSVEKVYHAVLDPAAFIVNKDAVRRPSYWAGGDRRPKFSPKGADPGSVLCPALERLRHLSEKDALTALLAVDGDALAIAKTQTQSVAHPAKMADEVARWLVGYGSAPGGVVGDNFCGGGTTIVQARGLGRHFVGSDLNEKYVEQAREAVRRVSFGEYLSSPEPPRSTDTGRPRPRARIVRHVQAERCRQCRTEFVPKKPWQLFCSDPCRFLFNNDRRRKHDE